MQKINFQNLPNTTTPINATNLNAIQTNAETAINGVASDLSTLSTNLTNYVNGTNTMGNIKTTGLTTNGYTTLNGDVNILGNMIMFIPMGIFIKKYLKLDNKKIVILLLFIISMTIEVIQLIIGRVYDIDDVLLNIIGGFIGFLFADSFNKISSKSKILNNNIILNILAILLLGGVICFLFI